MAYEKGQSGNPGGRPKEKIFTDALRLAVNVEVDDNGQSKKKLRQIAERLVAEALAGESWAIQQVADRLEGKPVQSIENADGEGFELIHTIRRIIVDSRKPDEST